jgi:predicted acetyltransferase
MMIVRPSPAVDEFVRVFETAWAFGPDPERSAHAAALVGREQRFGAYEGDRLVGTTLDYDMALTVAGGGQVAMGGVSYVAVHPLFRRRGGLRALMQHQLEDLHARQIPVAGLGASEGTIYGRFGYGPATRDIDVTCPRGLVPVHDVGLELVDRDSALPMLPEIHEAARRRQVGDVRAYPGRWLDLVPDDGYVLVRRERDGFAVYRLDRPDRWSSHTTLVVEHLAASTAEAYRSLWSYLLNVDLTERVVARGRPEGEPLQWMLRDPRDLAITGVSDHLWIRLVDLAAALSARTYGAEGSLVLEVADDICPWNAGRWRLDGGPDGSACRRATTAEASDVALDCAVLGALYLGGIAPGPLASAGRLRGDERAVARAAAMFGTPTPPWCSTGF